MVFQHCESSLTKPVYYLITIENDNAVKTRVDARSYPPIIMDDIKYSAKEVIHTLNYGVDPLFERLATIINTRPDVEQLTRIWDRSLLTDFANQLFADKKDVYKLISGVNLGLQGKFEDYMEHQNVQLLTGVLASFRGVGNRANVCLPNSHIVHDLIFTVQYLKETITHSGAESPSPYTCISELESFWKTTFGK